MHDNWDTEITQCETKKNCVATTSCIMLVQQKKVQSFDLQPLSRNVVHNANGPISGILIFKGYSRGGHRGGFKRGSFNS